MERHRKVVSAEEIDHLYQLPLRDFIEARNALARRLRQSGEHQACEQVQRLKKPVLSAWALNQLYWHATEVFNELLDSGDRLRLENSASAAVYLRDAALDRRRVVDKALKRAETIARNNDYKLGKPLRERLSRSLEVVTLWGDSLPGKELGRWTEDLEPPGFEVLLASATRWAGEAPMAAPPNATNPERQSEARVRLLKRSINELMVSVAEKEELKGQLEAEAERASAELESARHFLVRAEEELHLARSRAEEALLECGSRERRLRESCRELEKAKERLEKARREFAGLL